VRTSIACRNVYFVLVCASNKKFQKFPSEGGVCKNAISDANKTISRFLGFLPGMGVVIFVA
jgi:hypothetical protein